MTSLNEVLKIGQQLERGERTHDNRRACVALVARVRQLLSSGTESVEVRRKLEQLVGRFGNARF
jgi:hypothetical protein